MKNLLNTIKRALSANDFLGGNYLRKEDIKEPRAVTIKAVYSEVMPGSTKQKLVIAFEELPKPLVLNNTNIATLVDAFGTDDTSQWKGQVTLYVNPNVQYSGKTVGGIRLHRPAIQPSKAESFSQAQVNGHDWNSNR